MRMIFRCDPALSDHLPRPVAARGALPDWLRAMPANAHSRDPRPRHPHRQAMPALRRRHGLWRHDPAALRRHRRPRRVLVGLECSGAGDPGPSARAAELSCAGAACRYAVRGHGQAAIKFNSFWTIELEPGWSLFATHPVNRGELPFRLVTGLVDADRFHDGGINFPAIWTEPGFSGALPKGTPVAQVFAVPRARPNWCSKTSTTPTARAYANVVAEVLATPGVYRKRFRARRGRAWFGHFSTEPLAKTLATKRTAQRGLVQPQPAVRRRGQRHRDGAEHCWPQPVGRRIGAHGAVEIACFLQHGAEIERRFGVVRFQFERLAIGAPRRPGGHADPAAPGRDRTTPAPAPRWSPRARASRRQAWCRHPPRPIVRAAPRPRRFVARFSRIACHASRACDRRPAWSSVRAFSTKTSRCGAIAISRSRCASAASKSLAARAIRAASNCAAALPGRFLRLLSTWARAA